MTVLITGGAGFIGTRLAQRLAREGRPFEIADMRPSPLYSRGQTPCDVTDPSRLERAPRFDAIAHLAAVHRDDVRPSTLYETVNVGGARNVCALADRRGANTIVFTSTVAVYGFADPETDETGPIAPFNEYGRTKHAAEEVLRAWQAAEPDVRSLTIVRPTVVFGEGNRGNVFTMLKAIRSGAFAIPGDGENVKSLAYVENVASFIEAALDFGPGVHLFNYVDPPNLSLNQIVARTRLTLTGGETSGLHIPMGAALMLGRIADAVSATTGARLPVSAIRVRKLAATTAFASRAHSAPGFAAPVPLLEALDRTIAAEFLTPNVDRPVFETE